MKRNPSEFHLGISKICVLYGPLRSGQLFRSSSVNQLSLSPSRLWMTRIIYTTIRHYLIAAWDNFIRFEFKFDPTIRLILWREILASISVNFDVWWRITWIISWWSGYVDFFTDVVVAFTDVADDTWKFCRTSWPKELASSFGVRALIVVVFFNC